jgi:predicted lipid-binding transport protein (Tim44 family)
MSVSAIRPPVMLVSSAAVSTAPAAAPVAKQAPQQQYTDVGAAALGSGMWGMGVFCGAIGGVGFTAGGLALGLAVGGPIAWVFAGLMLALGALCGGATIWALIKGDPYSQRSPYAAADEPQMAAKAPRGKNTEPAVALSAPISGLGVRPAV